ncbi:hypothetical protein ISN44_As12g028450 [Arabidopsis suecica]|uniref:Uncharacterized protein n=1 Tax=Arabidopsis suecica TaxID=45249 RepID=A0A8T1YN98_ARASU|nr:hypothetical protein ISN44_As12g028450 [Arabidopsis suecica]
MMKHTQTIFTKYCGRAISTIASSPLSSTVQHRWKEQDGLVLGAAFIGGYLGHALINIYKRREHWYKVKRMLDESDKRLVELTARQAQYSRAVLEETRANFKPTTS